MTIKEVRLIDANALKEDFMNDYNNYMMESLRGNQRDVIRISEVIERIEDAPTIEVEPDNGWISVKDRLPPTGVPVLIYVYNIEEMTVVSLDHDGLGFSNADEWFNIKNIHHWQHLPEPPKSECGLVDDDTVPNDDMRPDNEGI